MVRPGAGLSLRPGLPEAGRKDNAPSLGTASQKEAVSELSRPRLHLATKDEVCFRLFPLLLTGPHLNARRLQAKVPPIPGCPPREVSARHPCPTVLVQFLVGGRPVLLGDCLGEGAGGIPGACVGELLALSAAAADCQHDEGCQGPREP